jgi:hypothetical protein
VLIAQDKARVERYVRDGERWVLTEIDGLDDSLVLASIGCELRLRDVYERVDLSSPDARAPA